LIKGLIDLNRKLSRIFSERYIEFVRSGDYKQTLLYEINTFLKFRNYSFVLEVGGIDRPLLCRSEEIKYDGLDIENKEKCLEIYDNYYVQSIEEPLQNKYDLICSFALLEHVRDNNKSFQVMLDALINDGMMIHYLPSKYHPYSIILRVLGSKLAIKLLEITHPQIIGISGYPSFFNQCSVNDMQRLCNKIGFKAIKIIPYYRANFYFEIFFPFFFLITLWENICKKFNWYTFCSGFIIIAKK